MSEEEARRDFVGFARDIQQLRFSLRSALGLSPMRPFERVRMTTQELRESVQSRQRQRQEPQQDQGHQGQRAATPLRGFGILDRFLQPLQPQGAEEPELTSEELKAKKAAEEEWHRNELARLKQEEIARVRSQSNFSVEI
ncbi:hypothetical protein HQ586_06400 [Candidatus Bathyarchaeota archaeon]|nr:hypothetical protein [Candidatus Bathyarchaeota archaeon]